ncbi:MAG TPA: hypothetical protein VIO58_01725 [Candidatus Methanoperedens sp.]
MVKSIFTEKLGDMTLTAYETKDAAATGRNGTMRIWVAEPPDHNIANDAFNSMNSMLGGSTGHGRKHEKQT